MKLPKWLPLQMAQMRTTCSKREGEITFFFYCNTLQKWRKKYQNVGQMLPNLMSKTKEKTLTTCF